MESVNILGAFAAGLISFISPCVLPIVPGYLSFISGASFDEMQSAESNLALRKRLATNSLFFVLGFSLVFISLGASATIVGQFLRENLRLIGNIAGHVIALLGLHMTGIIQVPFLNYEKRFQTSGKKLSLVGSFVVGLAFAFGWTPCIGPILAAILAIASQEGSVAKGMVLLTSYSLGLGIPFLITGFSLSAFYKLFNKMKKHLHKIEVVSGVLLVLVGILIMTNYLTILSGYLAKWFPFLNDLG